MDVYASQEGARLVTSIHVGNMPPRPHKGRVLFIDSALCVYTLQLRKYKDKETLVRNIPPTGSLSFILSQAKSGDVIKIPCLVYLRGDYEHKTYDFVSLYACVLLASHTRIVLSRLYEQIGQIQTRDSTNVFDLSKKIQLFDEHGRPIEWQSDEICKLFIGRGEHLAKEYLSQLESPSTDSH